MRRALHAKTAADTSGADGGGSPSADVPVRPAAFGQRAAAAAATAIGSWRFLIAQTVVLAAWVTLNIVGWVHRWDPYPFILLNLMLSFQAAYSAPVLLMSANRQGALDREQATKDYLVNQRAEAQVEQLLELVHAQLHQNAEILALLRPPPT
jgi:uncharacterized membrane protein